MAMYQNRRLGRKWAAQHDCRSSRYELARESAEETWRDSTSHVCTDGVEVDVSIICPGTRAPARQLAFGLDWIGMDWIGSRKTREKADRSEFNGKTHAKQLLVRICYYCTQRVSVNR